MRGELLALLAPCVIGYAEIATRLASRPDEHVATIPSLDRRICRCAIQAVAAKARAHMEVSRTGLQIPGMPDVAPVDDAKLLASILAVECTRLALPPMPLLRPEDLMEFRDANATLLRGFRRSMLRYAADLNGKIKDMDREGFEKHTKFFIETQIVPAMDELNATMNDPARPWHKRAIDGLKLIPEVGGAFLAGGPHAALTKAITATAAQFFVEVAAKGDKEEALKRSGLTYLLRLKAFYDERK